MSARSSGERRVATVTDLFGRVETAPGGIGWSAVASASEAILLDYLLGVTHGAGSLQRRSGGRCYLPGAVGAPP